MDINEDMMFSTFCAANSRATYIRYIGAGKIRIKQQDVLPFLMTVIKDASVAKTVGIIHFDVPSFYISSQKDVLLIIQDNDALVKNDLKPAPFHASSFHRHAWVIFNELQVCNLDQDKERFPTFVLILTE